MAGDELTKALLLEEVCGRRAIAEALFASVSGDVPLLQTLVESGATSPSVLARYLERREVPFVKHVVPAVDLVDRLPRDLCRRLFAIPVAHDAVTRTVDIAVADPTDPHPASEIAYHLGAQVRVLRASVASIEEALRRLRMRPGAPSEPGAPRQRTLPPPEPKLTKPRRGGLVIEEDSAPPPPVARIRTPPWGTPANPSPRAAHERGSAESEERRIDDGSDIPIPLTRKTFHPPAVSQGRGFTRPDPNNAGMGEGYALDTTGFVDVVERRADSIETPGVSLPTASMGPLGSFIPGPPPLPGSWTRRARENDLGGRQPFPEMSGVLGALRNAGSRDEILELVLTGGRLIAVRIALFVVKKGGYLGWVGSPEFADRTSLQSVLIPLDANSIFDRAIREDLYVGPIVDDHVHAPLLRAMRSPRCDVALVPVRVSGKTAVIIVAAELESPAMGARRLEELARAGGEAFARIVRTRR